MASPAKGSHQAHGYHRSPRFMAKIVSGMATILAAILADVALSCRCLQIGQRSCQWRRASLNL